MNALDYFIYTSLAILAFTFIFIIVRYAKGLKGSPRELYIIFLAKIVEYTAYGAMNLCFALFLSADIGLSDIAAGSYIGIWSMALTLITMLVGSVADAIGVKKTLVAGTVILVIARFVMPFTTNIYAITAFGFIPLAFGMAMKGPVLSVGIKKFTTPKTAALGFGLFYTLMNVGWAAGAWIFDAIRGAMGEQGTLTIIPNLIELSTYQTIFAVGFFGSFANLVILLLMRDNVELSDETGKLVSVEGVDTSDSPNTVSAIKNVGKKAFFDSIKIIKDVITEKPFWVFLAILSILIPVKLVFYHFHYTYPKYAIRVLGEGLKIGAIFGVLNPVMVIFLTPLFATLTTRVRSSTVLLWGTTISAASVLLVAFDPSFYEPLMGTWFSELVLERWLAIPAAQQQPLILGLVIMVFFFTIGEAIWSPRLMQFTAEIAPKGKEGSYIALSYLPYFGCKFVVGPLSGWLVATYTPEGATSYPHQYLIWLWIGAMALFSPLGLALFKGYFRKAEDRNQEQQKSASESAVNSLEEQEA